MIVWLLLGLGFGGYLVLDAADNARFALSDDCKTLLLRKWTEKEVGAWLNGHLHPAYERAREGGAKVRMRGVHPESFEEVEPGVYRGPVFPDSADDVALYLYSKVSNDKCAVLKYHLDGGLEYPSEAARCLYLICEYYTRMNLYLDTDDPIYEVDAQLESNLADACNFASEGGFTALTLFGGAS